MISKIAITVSLIVVLLLLIWKLCEIYGLLPGPKDYPILTLSLVAIWITAIWTAMTEWRTKDHVRLSAKEIESLQGNEHD
jgi:type VI protein secretion system component VasK